MRLFTALLAIPFAAFLAAAAIAAPPGPVQVFLPTPLSAPGYTIVGPSNPFPVYLPQGFSTNTSVVISPSGSAAAGIVPQVSGTLSALNLKAAPGNFYSAYVTAGATPLWLFVVNSTSVSNSNGTFTTGTASGNLQDCIGPFTNQTGSINYAPAPPEVFSSGITIYQSSSACPTLTSSTSATALHGSAQ